MRRLERNLQRIVVRALGSHDFVRVVALLTVAAPVLAMCLLYAASAEARPGGGGSFSGGSSRSSGGGGSSSSRSSGSSSSSSSSGGSSGDGDALAAIIYLCFEYPAIGIPLLVIFIIVAIVRSRSKKAMEGSEWSSGAPSSHYHPPVFSPPPVVEPLRGRLEGLRRTDPGFSIVVFEDFLYFLYAE